MESVRERVDQLVSQMAKDRLAPITRNLDKSCGNTLEWLEMKRTEQSNWSNSRSS